MKVNHRAEAEVHQGKSEITRQCAEAMGYEVIEIPLSRPLSKGEICKKLEESGALEAGRYDCALPQNWVDEAYKLGIDVRGSYVWDYSEDRIFGKPFNILGAYLEVL